MAIRWRSIASSSSTGPRAGEVAVEDGAAHLAEAIRQQLLALGEVGAGGGAAVPLDRGDGLGADLDHGDDVAEIPVLGVGDLAGVALAGLPFALGRPLDEAAVDRAAGGARAAAAGEDRQVLRRGDLAERLEGGEGQRREARGRGGEAAGGGEGSCGWRPAPAPCDPTSRGCGRGGRAHRRANSGSGVPKPPSGSARQTSSSPPWSRVSTVHRETQCSSVIEIEEFIGVALARSRAPQYFTKAILARRGYGGLAHASVSPRSPVAPKRTG